MAKIRCRRCDICGVEIDERDFQFHIFLPRKKPNVFKGCPALGMKRVDLCDECGARLEVEVEMAVKGIKD